MKTQAQQPSYTQLSKSALRTYATGAAVLYCSALAYCILTGRYFETALVGTVMAGLATMIGYIYVSIGKESVKKEMKGGNIQYNQAA